MSSLRIPCPKCGSELKLPDLSLLGRRGKCPKCAHRFVLEEPEEVELELAEAPVPAASARWVPDNAKSSPAAHSSRAAVADAAETALSDFAALESAGSEASGAARLKEIRRKDAKRRKISIVAGGVIAVTLAGTFLGVRAFNSSPEEEKEQPKASAEFKQEKDELREKAAFARSASPTRGEPIELLFAPPGSRLLIHLRPAELWKENSVGEEVRFCLGPLGEWTEAKIKETCLFEPSQIDELLFCLFLGAPGSPPEVSGVVRLVEEHKKSEFIQLFQKVEAQYNDEEYTHPVYVAGERTYLLHDTQTIAFCPTAETSAMIDAARSPLATSTAIEDILQFTDRDRHITLVFEPGDIRRHRDVLFSEDAQDVSRLILNWIGDEVETVAWSAHFSENAPFYTEMLLRNHHVTTPVRLQKDLSRQLDDLPREILAAVEKMSPKQAGRRTIIGRFPAMMKVFSLATVAGIGDHHVQLATRLPERAGPNIALGTLLAWDESLVTDFSKQAVKPSVPTESNLPKTVAGRLKIKIDIDFRKTPLREALAYIAEETKTEMTLDADALKDAGMTQNMEQNQKLGVVPAIDAIKAIVGRYQREKMVVVVDEQKQLLTITTQKFADMKGWKVFDIGL